MVKDERQLKRELRKAQRCIDDLTAITEILEIVETFETLKAFRKTNPNMYRGLHRSNWQWVFNDLLRLKTFRTVPKKAEPVDIGYAFEKRFNREVETEMENVRCRLFEKMITDDKNGKRIPPIDAALWTIDQFFTKREYAKQYPTYAEIAATERRFALSPKMRILQTKWKNLK